MKNVPERKIWRSIIFLAVALAMLFSMQVPALADDTVDITISWPAEGITEVFTHADRQLMPQVGPYSFVEINTFGTWRMSPTPAVGITIETLLDEAGIDTSALEPTRLIRFVSADGFSAIFTWQELSQPRYSFTYPSGTSGQAQLRYGVIGSQVPAMLAFNQGNAGPRNYIGILFPTEQIRNMQVQRVNLIEIGGLAEAWPNPYMFIENGSNLLAPEADKLASGEVVPARTLLRIGSTFPGQNAK